MERDAQKTVKKQQENRKKKKVRNTRPSGFNDVESLAKDLLNASGVNYFEWLDEQHKKVIFERTLENKDKIVDLLMK